MDADRYLTAETKVEALREWRELQHELHDADGAGVPDPEILPWCERLNALESSADGFKIAEVDFELRGPGDVLGTRQHGELPLRVANLVRDSEILLEARGAAFELVESGEFDQPPFAPLKIRVLERFGRLMDLPQSG